MKFIDNVKKRIIVIIDDKINYSTKIAKVLDVTYAPINLYLNELIKEGIVIEVIQPIKRKKVVKLTNKGEKIKKLLIKLSKFEK